MCCWTVFLNQFTGTFKVGWPFRSDYQTFDPLQLTFYIVSTDTAAESLLSKYAMYLCAKTTGIGLVGEKQAEESWLVLMTFIRRI